MGSLAGVEIVGRNVLISDLVAIQFGAYYNDIILSSFSIYL